MRKIKIYNSKAVGDINQKLRTETGLILKQSKKADDEIPTIIPNKMSPREFLTTLDSFNPEFLFYDSVL